MNAHRPTISFVATLVCCLGLLASGCASGPAGELTTSAPAAAVAATEVPTTAPVEAAAAETVEPSEVPTVAPTSEPAATEDVAPEDPTPEQPTPEQPTPEQPTPEQPTPEQATPAPTAATTGCETTAALFVTRGSANSNLEDPFVQATCAGDTITILTNAVPDYTYIGTSPGVPGGRQSTYALPATPALAAETTPIPYLGPAAITLSGIPIFGPTEGTGGDVDSLPGILSVCGSHNGPTGFHAHKIGTSTETDCLFTPAEVAAAPQLVGYALDGFPIYTGADQYTSSWQLTNESLFASDTWAAHAYVQGSGDLDRCNGLTDANGNYAYYSTDEFPYVLGCFVGEVEIGGGGGDSAARPGPGAANGDGDGRPERPNAGGPGGGDDRPARPEPPAGDDG